MGVDRGGYWICVEPFPIVPMIGTCYWHLMEGDGGKGEEQEPKLFCGIHRTVSYDKDGKDPICPNVGNTKLLGNTEW